MQVLNGPSLSDGWGGVGGGGIQGFKACLRARCLLFLSCVNVSLLGGPMMTYAKEEVTPSGSC